MVSGMSLAQIVRKLSLVRNRIVSFCFFWNLYYLCLSVVLLHGFNVCSEFHTYLAIKLLVQTVKCKLSCWFRLLNVGATVVSKYQKNHTHNHHIINWLKMAFIPVKLHIFGVICYFCEPYSLPALCQTSIFL